MIGILAGASIGLVGLIVLSNWYTLYESQKTGRSASTAPLLGGLLLALGLVGFPETRPYAWLGGVADYDTLLMIFAIPMLNREAWSTASINMVHRFISDSGGPHDDIRLFKGGTFTINRKFDPPVPSGDDGFLVVERSLTGDWREESGEFVMEGYAGDRILRILIVDGVHRTREESRPEDLHSVEDQLDAIELKKVK